MSEMRDLREGIKSLRSEGVRSDKYYVRNKQGRSKVLTEKTIQVSVACFYNAQVERRNQLA